MADVITIRVDGLQELSRALRTLAEDVEKKFAGRATGKAAQIVKRAAKANIRANQSVDTGLLEKNVIVKKLGARQSGLTSEHIVTEKKAVYQRKVSGRKPTTRRTGVFEEFGTVHQAAKPWLRPALEHNIQPAIDAMADSLRADLTKAGA